MSKSKVVTSKDWNSSLRKRPFITERRTSRAVSCMDGIPIPKGLCDEGQVLPMHMVAATQEQNSNVRRLNFREAANTSTLLNSWERIFITLGWKQTSLGRGKRGDCNYYFRMFLGRYVLRLLWMNLWLPKLFVIQTHLCWGDPNHAGTWKIHGELFPSSYPLVNWGRIFYHVGFSFVLFSSVFSTGSIETLQKILAERVTKHASFWGSESRPNWLSHKLTSDTLSVIHHKVIF